MNYSNLFKILADENRLKILSLLKDKNLCGCNILEHLDITQPTLSHHMEVLLNADLVSKVRKGNKIFYQLNRYKINELSKYLASISNRKVVNTMEDNKMEKTEECSTNCECGCQEGKECTCGADCKCDDNCDCGCQSGKCNCGPDCKCGCQEGKECTCGDDCKCDDNCDCVANNK
jgi:ArsR family transcriptional regulator